MKSRARTDRLRRHLFLASRMSMDGSFPGGSQEQVTDASMGTVMSLSASPSADCLGSCWSVDGSAPGGSQELGTDATMMTVMSLSASPSAPSSATMLAMGPEIREPIVQRMDAVSTMHTCPLMVGMLCGADHMAVHKGLVCRSAKIPFPLPQLSSFTGHWYCRHEPWNLCARLRHGTVPLHLSRDASREPCGPPPHQSAVV